MANSKTIEAALATDSQEPFVIRRLTLREPHANEIRVKVVATGICHTDIMTKNKGLCEFPFILGHEGVGIVDAIGSGVKDFELGDHVIMTYDYCGHCPACEQHHTAFCEQHGDLNFSGSRPDGSKVHRNRDGSLINGSFFQQSSFATYALSHASNTIKIDKSLPLPMLAPLACGVQTGAGTVINSLQVQTASSVAIYGCGCVGLAAILAAKVCGASNIIAVDLQQRRLELAIDMGATHIINPSKLEGDLANAVRSLTENKGSHYAIDTTGQPQVLRQAFEATRPMGKTAMIAPGVPGTELTIEMLSLLPGKSIQGIVQGDAYSKDFIPKMIELWQQGQFPFQQMISYFHGIEQIDRAATAMANGDVIKPVVILDSDYYQQFPVA